MNDELVGQIIGQHRVQQKLATGESSDLYVIQNLNLNRHEVLKRGRVSASLTPQRLRELFENESRILELLPRDVRPDLLVSNVSVPELFLELVGAASLETYLIDWTNPEPKTFPPESAILEIALSLVRRVAACHHAGVVVADLKPDHVLIHVESPLQVTLVDFGLSVRGSSALVPQDYAADYAAPEILSGTSATPASDVYSLGRLLRLLLHAWVLRRRPACGTDAGDLADATADVHPRLRTLLRGLTQSSPVRRPPLPDVEAVLARCLEELSDSVSPLDRLTATDREGQADELLFWVRRCERMGLLTSAWRVRAAEVILQMPESDAALANHFLSGCQFSELNDLEQCRYCKTLALYLERTQQPSASWTQYRDLFHWAVQRWAEVEPLWFGLIHATPLAEREAVARQAKQCHPNSGTITFLLARAVYRPGNESFFFELGCQAFRLGYHSVRDAIGFHAFAEKLEDSSMQTWFRDFIERSQSSTADDCLALHKFDRETNRGMREFQILEKGLALAPRDLRLRETYADALFRRERWEIVVETLRSVADSTRLRRWLAFALCNIKEYKEARPILEELTGSEDAEPDVFSRLGHCLSVLNHREQARAAYRAGCQRFPDDQSLRSSLETLR